MASSMISYLVKITKFPKEDQKLLVELDLLGGVGQVGLSERVSEQASQTFQHKVIILEANVVVVLGFFFLQRKKQSGKWYNTFYNIAIVSFLPPPCEFWTGSSQTGFVDLQTAKKDKKKKIIFELSCIDHSFI